MSVFRHVGSRPEMLPVQNPTRPPARGAFGRMVGLLSATQLLLACAATPRPALLPPGPELDTAIEAQAADAAGACRSAPMLELGQSARGSTQRRKDLFHASCAYGAASPDAVYRFRLTEPSRVVVRVTGGYDTAVHLRAQCADEDTEIACNDDGADDRHSTVEAVLPPGEYFAFVDGYASDNAGFFSIVVNASPAKASRAPAGLPRVPAGQGATVERVEGQQGVAGTVLFAKRRLTPRGLSRETFDAVAPHLRVEAVDTSGQVTAVTETDEQGRFALPLRPGSIARVRAVTRTTFLGNDVRVVSDPGTERPYEISTRPFRVVGDERITLRAGVGGVEPAGAFNILTQFVRYLPHVQRGFGQALPPLYAFWRRGNNRALPQGSITAFLLDYHRHRGAYALQIQGGEAGREDASDSDQFDDPVILHEFSHFVVHTLAGHYSIGGLHRNGELHFPGQALDEGAASAMASAVAGDARYWDTSGLEPAGEVLVDEDSEYMHMPDRGIGSQNTAQAIVWDLIDGVDGIADRDGDGVALGLTGVMRIYKSFRDDNNAFPGIHTMLERAVELNMITAEQATQLVREPVDHGFVFPVPATLQWPIDLPLPGEVSGRVDGQTQPAPSGGRNVSINGLDAIKTYRLRVPRRGMVYIDLNIQGPGSQASGTDLDLQLFTRDLRPIAQSNGESSTESIRAILDEGTYIVFVRDGDTTPMNQHIGTQGNRANFTLRVRQ